MSETVEILGLERLQSTLRHAGAEIASMNRAASAAANLVTSRGRSNAPKRTGRLAASVHPVSVHDGNAEIGSSLIYAPVIHNGWAAHHIAANPFLSRALDETAGDVLDLYYRDADTALAHVKGA